MAILRFYSREAFHSSRLTQLLHSLQQVTFYILFFVVTFSSKLKHFVAGQQID